MTDHGEDPFALMEAAIAEDEHTRDAEKEHWRSVAASQTVTNEMVCDVFDRGDFPKFFDAVDRLAHASGEHGVDDSFDAYDDLLELVHNCSFTGVRTP